MKFWGPLFLSHFIGWLFLWVAARALCKRWQDSGIINQTRDSESSQSRWSMETSSRKNRREFSAGNAVELLLGSAPLTRWIIWMTLCLFSLVLITHWSGGNRANLTYGGAKICAWFLKILAAIQACKFFSESKSSGVLELMLCTPLQNSDIIRAQWRRLRKLFLLPSSMLLISTLVILALAGSTAKPTGVVWKAWVGEPGLAQVCWLGFRMGADMLAVGWFGMCLGLTLKKPILAPGLTILLVLIVPSMLSWLDLVADMLFISWGTARLQKDFRDVLIQRYQQVTTPAFTQEVSPA
jgi:hypothetical protein